MEERIGTSKDGVIIVLSDNDVAVRTFRHSDIASISRHANNRNIWLALRNRFPHPYTQEAARSWIEHTLSPQSHARSGKWPPKQGDASLLIPTQYAVTFRGEAIGSIGLDFGQDIYFRTAELGYWLSEEYWGRRIMSSVVEAFVTWAWSTFDILVRLNGLVAETNPGSARLLEKAGFVLEGRRQDAICKDGKVHAELMFGALRPS
ncbi:unnamed protein product [Zymoseptoria tritici ST99CH_1A5]|uniref:N-acetyltransferase domain-containing protein n=3 Tax=Zymoseptoria tritici TaxID=1047171 RepID=A0A1X7RHH6_ZYMT9|nr:unnamed protein product [Zymoseptoria tritici ST99CH_3D7]SMR43003.1 unnamed protein product [Zymoseptoria tritici ST99CH_1E4]SMR45174.1 unnamed protein product [Zymoseptoria tritici ST99CH_3D1]SMY20337.1 unnamed protein product [Zymoseptoria tritici ST99CH_1A5]